MARKEATVVIAAAGRDKNKVFHLLEMPASQAEAWALRAFFALAKSGVDVPEDIAQSGMAGVAQIGLKAFAGLAYEDAAPLLAEMMNCVQLIPNPEQPNVRRTLVEDDIEEIKTRLFLRAKVFELHVDFSMPAAAFLSGAAPTAG